jgi:hypothetical protein
MHFVLALLLLQAPVANPGTGTIAAPAAVAGPPRDSSFILSCAAFHADLTEADLIKRFGAGNVRRAPVTGSDDGPAPGTVIFPDRPDQRLEIAWFDIEGRRHPRFIRAQEADDKTRWRTPQGITLGDDLRALEGRNAKPFRLSGFYSEVHGLVRSWVGGRLEVPTSSEGGCTLGIHFSAGDETDATFRTIRQVAYGSNYSSAHPAMQTLNPRVVTLLLGYPHRLK